MMPMRDSDMTDEWIANALRLNPCAPVLSPDGQQTGNFRLPPLRLGYSSVFTPTKSEKSGVESYSATFLFAPGTDLGPALVAYSAMVAKEWPNFVDPASGPRYGDNALANPFRRCEERYDQSGVPLINQTGMGYTPGCFFTSASTLYKPNVVDARGNPIVDPARVYSGVWAIPCVNLYSFPGDKSKAAQQKKGVKFGLQALMIIADDQKIGGGGAMSAATAFAGVNTDQFGAQATQAALAGFGQPAPTPGPMGGISGGGLVPAGHPTPQVGGAQFGVQPLAPAPLAADPMAAFRFGN